MPNIIRYIGVKENYRNGSELMFDNNKKWARNDHICRSCYFWNMKDNKCEKIFECERPKRQGVK